jgi:endonuclease YncB( thermonuclease family)
MSRIIVLIIVAILIATFTAVDFPGRDYFTWSNIKSWLDSEEVETEELSERPTIENLVQARVVRVIDGDTIDVEINDEEYRVRYIGIDTPELGRDDRAPECFAQAARDKNIELVANRSVWLESDVSDVDQYGRLLRYVYVGEVLVNAALVAEGYANTFTLPPDVARAGLFRDLERTAREAERGLWGECR